jgi:hypothetical protein
MPLDSATLERLLCDCALHRATEYVDGTILDYGRTVYTTPANLYNAVVVRDRGCRYPGCDRRATWCEAHHVVAWKSGGHTKIGNLVQS